MRALGRGALQVKQQDLFNITGHVAFITGAASGLGLAYAEVMAQNGAKVVLADVDKAGLDKAATRLASAGCAVEPAVVDIADHAALRAAIDGAAERHGRLDAVFANAGVTSGPGFALSPAGEIDAMDLALFQRAIEVNLAATFMTMRFAATHMKRRRGGSIVATASIAGLRSEGLTGYGYTAAKSAVIGMGPHAPGEIAAYKLR